MNRSSFNPENRAFVGLSGDLIPHAKNIQQIFLRILTKKDEFTNEELVVKDWLHKIQKWIPTTPNDISANMRDLTKLLVESIINCIFVSMVCQDGIFPDGKRFSPKYSFSSVHNKQMFLKNFVPIISSPLLEHNINPILEIIDKVEMSEHFCNLRKNQLINVFYSSFLRNYNPETAKTQGVINTHQTIVDFIIQGIDSLLRSDLGRNKGVIDPDITIIDPASGTSTFPLGILRFATDRFFASYSTQNKRAIRELTAWYNEGFLKNLYTFEVLPAPYLISHFCLWLAVEDLGITSGSYNLPNMYLRNALELKSLESRSDVVVVLGNPPYRRLSKNRPRWLSSILKDYRKMINERNVQPLSDDYIKFIRWAQWIVQQEKKGIVAYITNNTFLDGKIFRGMRKELLRVFDQIYIVNLHGDPRKGETGNPFDIKLGVCIFFFVYTNQTHLSPAKIHYWSLPQPQKIGKFTELAKGFDASKFSQLSITEDHLFTPTEIIENTLKRYRKFYSLDQLFGYKSVGIATHRDKLVIDVDKETLRRRLKLFFEKREEDLESMGVRVPSTLNFDKVRIQGLGIGDRSIELIKHFGFRGFDERYLSHEPKLIDRYRKRLMDNISDTNPALIVTKLLLNPPFTHVFITDKPFHKCFLSPKSKESAYGFVIKIRGNSNVVLPSLNYHIEPEMLLNYVYGVLFSQTYRKRYESLLIRDFPKIPFPKNESDFLEMSDLGKKLISLHLLNSININKSEFPISSSKDLKITKISYSAENQRIYLQPKDNRVYDGKFCIENITQEMWNFKIGNRQVLKQWLYSRRFSLHYKRNTIQRPISNTELEYFLSVCDVIAQTIALIPKIDQVYLRIDQT
ncbi:MAG: type ISP restriction/modification enzyme [Candidatus Heimdallarchaeota archaeon]